MTQIEVFAHPEMTEEKAAVFSEVMSVFDVIDITPDIKIETIRIRRDYKLKIPDAIIAASALVSNVPLLTADRAFNRLLNQDIILFDA
jgi:predicted nucleic acid-binding protein